MNHKWEKFVPHFPIPDPGLPSRFARAGTSSGQSTCFSPSERASQGNREAQEVQGSRSNIVPKRPTAPWFPLLVRKHTPLSLRLRVAQFVHARSCSTHGSTPLLGSPFIFEARLWLWWWTPSSQPAGSPPIGISRQDGNPSRDGYL